MTTEGRTRAGLGGVVAAAMSAPHGGELTHPKPKFDLAIAQPATGPPPTATSPAECIDCSNEPQRVRALVRHGAVI